MGSAAAPSNQAARVLATLAMCMFSGLIFWVFRRPKRRQTRNARSQGNPRSPPSTPDTNAAAVPAPGTREHELHAKMQRLLAELSKARTNADKQESALHAQDLELEAKAAECAKLLKLLEQRSHEIVVLQADFNAHKEQRKGLVEELAAANRDNQALKTEVQKLHVAIQSLQQQLTTRANLQVANEQLDRKTKELGVQLEGALLAKVKVERDCERALAESRAEVEHHQATASKAVAEYEKIREKSAEALRKLGVLQAEMGRINAELQQARRDRSNLLAQQAAERDVRRQLEAAVGAERTRSRALELENRNANEVISNMEARIRALERAAGP